MLHASDAHIAEAKRFFAAADVFACVGNHEFGCSGNDLRVTKMLGVPRAVCETYPDWARKEQTPTAMQYVCGCGGYQHGQLREITFC